MDIHADNAVEILKCMSKLSVGLEILSYGMDALGRLRSTWEAKVSCASLVFIDLLQASLMQWTHANHEPIRIIVIIVKYVTECT